MRKVFFSAALHRAGERFRRGAQRRPLFTAALCLAAALAVWESLAADEALIADKPLVADESLVAEALIAEKPMAADEPMTAKTSVSVDAPVAALDGGGLSAKGVPAEDLSGSGQAASGPTAESNAGGRELAEGETLTVTGLVIQKEVRSSFGQEQLSFILDSDLSVHLVCEPENLPDIPLGCRVKVRGTVEYFSKAGNPGQFDMAGYYRSLGIAASLKEAQVLERSEDYSRIREGLYTLRGRLKERLYRVLPEKEASIMATILLGDKSALDGGIKELYKRNGIVHILSISGLHITILGMGLYRMLRRLGLRTIPAAVCGGGLLVLYGIMTGMGVSACRAIGMYLLRMLAECLGRTYDMLTALGVMAVLMLAGRPEYLHHSGFLLSFGSIAAIGLLLPAFTAEGSGGSPGGKGELLLKRLAGARAGAWNGLRQSFLAGFSISLFTLPIHFWFYYEIPVYSILLNLLVLPLMGAVMAFGLLALLPGAGFLGVADCVILGFYEKLCLLCERLPGHTWTPGRPELWQVAVFYLLLALLAALGASWKKRRRLLWIVGMVLVLGIRFRGGVTAAFLDVGQGDCIVVESGGHVFLFDGGSSSESHIGKYVIIPYLKYRGITHIDAVLVSHSDADHCNGVEELLELGPGYGITVEQLVLPAIAEERRQEEFAGLLRAAGVPELSGYAGPAEDTEKPQGTGPAEDTERQSAGPAEETERPQGAGTDGITVSQESAVRVAYIAAGEEWTSGGLRFTCLHPPRNYPMQEPNACSECFYVESKGFSLLLTGDVEGEGEALLFQELEQREIRDVTVLKVAHHGSRSSTPAELLQLVRPKLAVISCGQDNRYGHPHPELTERLLRAGCTVLQTPETGAVTMRPGKQLRIYFFQN